MAYAWKKWFPPSLAQMKKINVRFDSWDPKAKGVKGFLFQVSNNRLLKSNPKCVVEQTLVSDCSPPVVEFTFKNDQKWVFPCSGRTDNEILMEMSLQSERLQNSVGLGEEEDMIDEEDEEAAAAGGKK